MSGPWEGQMMNETKTGAIIGKDFIGRPVRCFFSNTLPLLPISTVKLIIWKIEVCQ